jgi:hypothetical protein
LEGLDERSRNWALARQLVVTPEGVTFRNPTTTEIYNRLQQITEQQKLGLLKPDREKDQLTVVTGTPEHTGRVHGLSSTIGWAKGFVKDIGSYKKRDHYKKVLLMEAKVKEIVVQSFVELLQSTQSESVAMQQSPEQYLFRAVLAPRQRRGSLLMTSLWRHLAGLSSHTGGTVTRFMMLH